jgi:hypothetical protein
VAGVLSAAEVRRILLLEKHVKIDWRAQLFKRIGPDDGYGRVKVYELSDGPTRGELHVYARRGVTPDDYSAGMSLRDHAGNHLILLRANGPHRPEHWNKFPKRMPLPIAPHFHYLTERGQREHAKVPGRRADSFALMTTAYTDLSGAMDALAYRANILPEQNDLFTRVRTR